jgi:hypothetical protein
MQDARQLACLIVVTRPLRTHRSGEVPKISMKRSTTGLRVRFFSVTRRKNPGLLAPGAPTTARPNITSPTFARRSRRKCAFCILGYVYLQSTQRLETIVPGIFAAGGLLYVGVRGLDNIMVGLKARRAKASSDSKL